MKKNKQSYLDIQISSTTAGINDFGLLTGRNYLVKKIDYDIIATLKKIMIREVTNPEIVAHLEKWTMSQYQYLYKELLENKVDSFYGINFDKNKPMTPRVALEIMKTSPLIVLKIEPFYNQFLEFEQSILQQKKLNNKK